MIDKAVTKYKRDGLVPLIEEGPKYLAERLIRHATVACLLRTSLSEDALSEYVTNSDSNRMWRYGSEATTEISPPYGGEVPSEFQQLIGTQYSPQPFVYELSNTRLVGPHAISQSSEGKIIFEELGTTMNAYNRFSDTREAFGTTRSVYELLLGGGKSSGVPEYGTIINMVPRHGRSYDHVNYAHWFLENLPRLRALEQEPAPDTKLLIRPDLPDWAMESLELMDFSKEDYVYWNGGVSTAERLVITRLPYIHSFGSTFAADDRAWARDRLKSGIKNTGSPDTGSRILISRQAQRRKIVNFDEVIDALNQFGFDPIRPEEHTMEEVIDIYSDAEFIVGPHGAGMADMMYADNATIVEIFPKNEVRPVFYIIANEFGHEYDLVVGDDPPGTSYEPTRNKDILIDADELRATVQQAIDD